MAQGRAGSDAGSDDSMALDAFDSEPEERPAAKKPAVRGKKAAPAKKAPAKRGKKKAASFVFPLHRFMANSKYRYRLMKKKTKRRTRKKRKRNLRPRNAPIERPF